MYFCWAFFKPLAGRKETHGKHLTSVGDASLHMFLTFLWTSCTDVISCILCKTVCNWAQAQTLYCTVVGVTLVLKETIQIKSQYFILLRVLPSIHWDCFGIYCCILVILLWNLTCGAPSMQSHIWKTWYILSFKTKICLCHPGHCSCSWVSPLFQGASSVLTFG